MDASNSAVIDAVSSRKELPTTKRYRMTLYLGGRRESISGSVGVVFYGSKGYRAMSNEEFPSSGRGWEKSRNPVPAAPAKGTTGKSLFIACVFR